MHKNAFQQTDLASILYRNQGNTLTPDLILGILETVDMGVYSGVRFLAVPDYTLSNPPDRLITDDKVRVGEWLAQRVGQQSSWGGYNAIGLEDDSGKIVAAALIHGMTSTNAFCHVAFENRFSLKRVLIYSFFDYVFNQLGLIRITGLVDADNPDALRFDIHLGFEQEFIIPNGNGGDVHQLVMWREKCHWLNRRS